MFILAFIQFSILVTGNSTSTIHYININSIESMIKIVSGLYKKRRLPMNHLLSKYCHKGKKDQESNIQQPISGAALAPKK